MKMTIVIDSDDINGIEDAYKMVRIMYTKYVGTRGYDQRSFGKIEFIKMLRKFGNEALLEYKSNEDFELEKISSLRFTKTFSDNIWMDNNG